MNQTKIEWTDWTLNPVVGCTHGCPYCYARRQAKRQKQRCELCYQFIPHAHLERLKQITPRQKPKRIFINSMWDWNCKDINPDWCIKIIEKMRECKQHTFQILSKVPTGYGRYQFPPNVWLGTSVEGILEEYRILDLQQCPNENLRFVSFEPLLSPVKPDLTGIDWIIIGAQTQPTKLPPLNWVNGIVIKASVGRTIPVFIKSNLKKVWPGKLIQEFPE